MQTKFKCNHDGCQMSYVNKSILKRHIQAFHNPEKRFQCSICGKCLASHQNLREHSYTHSGEKPYKCPYPGCNASFRQGTHLSSHKKLEHSQENLPIINKEELILLSLTRRLSIERPDQLLSETPDIKIEIPGISKPYICSIPNIFS